MTNFFILRADGSAEQWAAMLTQNAVSVKEIGRLDSGR
jgi:hypothetical protein